MRRENLYGLTRADSLVVLVLGGIPAGGGGAFGFEAPGAGQAGGM